MWVLCFTNRHFCKNIAFANFPIFRGPCSWNNLFAIIISSNVLAKLRQNRHFRCFRQIRQHFGALLAGLIYLLSSFREQPWRNFAKISIFAKFANISGALVAWLIYSLLSFCQRPWRNFAKIAILAKFAVFAKFAKISGPF